MKPSIILQIEAQAGIRLSELKELNDLMDSIRYQHNGSYVLDGGALVALNFTGSESPMQLELNVKECATMKYINLSRNKGLVELRFAAHLPALREINLSECALEELTIPAGCSELQKAWLQKSQLKNMVFEGGCPKLLLLDLAGNQLEGFTLPSGFDDLAYLFLNDNELEHLVFETKEGAKESPLPSLDTLHLRNNNLRIVPENIVFSEKLKALYLAGNAPKNIPKVFLKSGTESCLVDARTWFSQPRNEKNEVVKLMLTGNGNAGKTTLLCALKSDHCGHDDDYHKTTHGVQMETLPLPGIIYNIWDFGGQEVYHGTHRLFMSAEALQVILCDPETEALAISEAEVKDRVGDDMTRHQPIQYWYETSRKLSPDSQFFVVQNKKDKFKKDDKEIRNYASDVEAEYVHLSARTGENIQDLKYFLKKLAPKLPDFEMLMPTSWM